MKWGLNILNNNSAYLIIRVERGCLKIIINQIQNSEIRFIGIIKGSTGQHCLQHDDITNELWLLLHESNSYRVVTAFGRMEDEQPRKTAYRYISFGVSDVGTSWGDVLVKT